MWRNQWPSIQLWRDQEATAASKRPQGKHEEDREEVTASLAAAVAISSDVVADAVLWDLDGIFVGQLWLWQTEGLSSLPPGFLWTLYQMGIQEKIQLLCQVHGCVPFVSYFFQLPEGERSGERDAYAVTVNKHNANFGNHAIWIRLNHTDFPKTWHVLSFDHWLYFPVF